MANLRTLPCFLAILTLTAATQVANAAVYCEFIGVPKGCVARPGVVLAPAPGVGAPGVGVTPRLGVGRPGVGVGVGVRGPANRGGPVNRVGRR